MLLQPANTLTPTPIEWLWPGYLAVGNVAILDGDPGCGKSLITLDLAARLSTGRPWPDGAAGPGPAPVILLCAEDVDAIIIARLNALGADLARVFLWPRLTDPGLPRLPADRKRIEEAIVETGAKLVIIDPIMAFLDRSVTPNSDASVRRILDPMAQLAERRRCVILLVRHLNKDDGSHALYRGGGSIGFTAACRLAWLAGRDPRMAERLVLAQQKNNCAPRSPSLAYLLPNDGPRIDWQGPIAWSADELAARRPRPSRRRAREFLRLFLEPGPRLTRDIWIAAAEIGLSESTIKRARRGLDIQCERVVIDGRRDDYWLLPGQQLTGAPSDTPDLDDWLRKWRQMYPPRAGEDE